MFNLRFKLVYRNLLFNKLVKVEQSNKFFLPEATMYVIEILKCNFYQRNEDGRYKMEKIGNEDEHLFIKFARNH